MQITVDTHPSSRLAAFTTRFPAPLSEIAHAQQQIATLLRLDAEAPLERDETVRQAVRDMLRYGGYKPTGRGKPASEYLVRAAGEGVLDSINVAVDVCNAVSLHSGLPISVLDLDLALPPLRIGLGSSGQRYVFNSGGQEIAVAGLLCVFDAQGPCANAVRDAQRTKTRPETVGTVSVIWGVVGHEERLQQATRWYRELLTSETGAVTTEVALTPSG